MININVESIGEVRGQIDPLLRAHYEEIALHRDQIPLDPDWDRYRMLERDGKLIVIAARNDERDLVGYAVFFVQPHMHYQQTLYAINDVLYVYPQYRGRAGLKIVRFAEEIFTAMGVDRLLWHIKVEHDFRPLMHRLGYADEDVIVGKMLKEN